MFSKNHLAFNYKFVFDITVFYVFVYLFIYLFIIIIIYLFIYYYLFIYLFIYLKTVASQHRLSQSPFSWAHINKTTCGKSTLNTAQGRPLSYLLGTPHGAHLLAWLACEKGHFASFVWPLPGLQFEKSETSG